MLEFVPDHARGILRIVAAGEIPGPAYVARIQAVLEEDPGLLHYDFCYDLRRYTGGTTHDDLAAYARWVHARFPQVPPGRISVLVTTDPGFHYWARLMALQFPRRRLECVRTMEEADVLIAAAAARRRQGQPEAQSPPPMSQL